IVLVREDEATGKRLVAYIVEDGQGSTSIQELRGYLGERVPEYMVPAAFVLLDRLPLTENGKIDRKALPPAEVSRAEISKTFTAPRTPMEEQIARIFTETLRLDIVGIDDDFFELGGHSLLATQLVSRIRKELKVEVLLRRIFEAPTVAQLAKIVDRLMIEQTGFDLVPIVPGSREGELPLSYAQQRLWFIDQLIPNNTVFNIPLILRLKGDLNLAVL